MVRRAPAGCRQPGRAAGGGRAVHTGCGGSQGVAKSRRTMIQLREAATSTWSNSKHVCRPAPHAARFSGGLQRGRARAHLGGLQARAGGQRARQRAPGAVGEHARRTARRAGRAQVQRAQRALQAAGLAAHKAADGGHVLVGHACRPRGGAGPSVAVGGDRSGGPATARRARSCRAGSERCARAWHALGRGA